MTRLFISLLFISLTNLSMAKTSKLSSAQVNQLWQNHQPKNNIATADKYPYATCFKAAAKKYGVAIELLLALAKGESNFNPSAKSKASAYGVMQIIPSTGKALGINTISALQDPCTSIKGGAKYIKQQLKRYNNNIHLAMAAYNYGPGAIKKTNNMPKGAVWYSHYIYDHYQSIVGKQAPHHYIPTNQAIIIFFNEPFRAKAFTDYLRKKDSRLNIEYFKRNQSHYDVVLSYQDQTDFKRSKALLKKYGFTVKE